MIRLISGCFLGEASVAAVFGLERNRGGFWRIIFEKKRGIFARNLRQFRQKKKKVTVCCPASRL
jgi:hypothetical protein